MTISNHIVSSISNQYISAILLKVALNTITLIPINHTGVNIHIIVESFKVCYMIETARQSSKLCGV